MLKIILKILLFILTLFSLSEAKDAHYQFNYQDRVAMINGDLPFNVVAAAVNTRGTMWSLSSVSHKQVGIGEYYLWMKFSKNGQTIDEACGVLFNGGTAIVKFRRDTRQANVSEFSPSVFNVSGLQLVIQKKKPQGMGYHNNNHRYPEHNDYYNDYAPVVPKANKPISSTQNYSL